MILGDADIVLFSEDRALIKPFNVKQVNPNSYDLRISDTLKTYKSALDHDQVLDCKKDNPTDNWYMTDEGFKLVPGIVYLAKTMETVDLTPHDGLNLCATLMGKSSLGRLGLDVHISAGFIDTGFKGQIVLELRVEQPLIIYPHMLIAQIKFEMSTPVLEPYGVKQKSKYQDQREIVASKMYQNF